MEIDKIAYTALEAINLAKKENIAICLTVVDNGGHIVYQIRMNDANFMTNEVSFLKAKTAFLFKCPTHILRKTVDTIPILGETIKQVPGDACMLEGGIPLTSNKKVVGGVGISGGNFEQDLKIANSFVEFFNKQN